MVQPKTFLIACGGTGGHLSPGIAVAQALTARGHRCRLLISKKSVDRALCRAYPELTFIPLDGIGFSGKLSDLPRCCWATVKNIVQSFNLIRKHSADAVIGFGGFTNVGVILAAACLRKPCFLHEANRVTGRTVRRLGRWATVVYVPEIDPHLPRFRQKPCGFPIRRDFQKIDQAIAKQRLGFDPKKPLVAVVGGSQGARVLHQWAAEHVGRFKRDGLQLLCLTGIRNTADGVSEGASYACPVSPETDADGQKTAENTVVFKDDPHGEYLKASKSSEGIRNNRVHSTEPTRITCSVENEHRTHSNFNAGIGGLSPVPEVPSDAAFADHTAWNNRTSEGTKINFKPLAADGCTAPFSETCTNTSYVGVNIHGTSAMNGENSAEYLRNGFPCNTENMSPKYSNNTECMFSETGAYGSTDEGNEDARLRMEYAHKDLPSPEPAQVASSSEKTNVDSSIRFIPFCHCMHIVYSAADVVIGRAGAGTIAELTRCETPSILVPLPTAADGHQVANARAFERQGGCIYLEQSDLPTLWEQLRSLLSDPQKRKAMSERLRTLGTDDATELMVSDIERTLGIA